MNQSKAIELLRNNLVCSIENIGSCVVKIWFNRGEQMECSRNENTQVYEKVKEILPMHIYPAFWLVEGESVTPRRINIEEPYY